MVAVRFGRVKFYGHNMLTCASVVLRRRLFSIPDVAPSQVSSILFGGTMVPSIDINCYMLSL